ncbi:GNAT family N-acetyltransferase [Oceaniglobus ichthyenteri]|uniref:GNAT family N-acetyltransferase n=1 Tax=Oceaniglobus ichthyenteri TaxID=2136177 RepID=UPI000D3571C5|nr:GNAT family protein [Oceaniglobus ichthyenteri]
MDRHDKLGRPVPNWQPPPRPGPETLTGRACSLHRLRADDHAAALHRAFSDDDRTWDYMSYGPFASASRYHRWVREVAGGDDPFFYAVHDQGTGRLGGVASFLRIAPEAGSIEIGHIAFSPELQRTVAATEAIYLMMGWAFGAGYRRFEWKCNALNHASRRAAQRFGFSFEGVFRQADVMKGRNRDTAWFACIDQEWPALQTAFEAWLAPSNFDANGQQRERLGDLTALVRVAGDPTLR